MSFGNLIHHCLQAADHQIGDRKDPRRIQRSCRQQTGGIFPGDRTWTSGCTRKTDAFGTTEEFLRSFGVSSIDELPTPTTDQMETFKQEAEQEIKLDVGGE